MTSEERRLRRRIVWATAVVFAGVILLWMLYLARGVLMLFYLSAMLAFGMSPLVRWIERHGWSDGRRVPRWMAILAIYIGVIAVLGAIVAVVVPVFVSQIHALAKNLPDYYDRAQLWLVAHRLMAQPMTVGEALQKTPNPPAAVTSVFGVVGHVVSTVLGALTVVMLSFYMLVEADELHRGFLRFFPDDRRLQVSRTVFNATTKVSAWLGGQLLLALIIGCTSACGFWLLGVPYFYLLALICAAGELIPMIGPLVAAIPAIVVAATVGVDRAIYVAIYLTVQQFLENHFVVPKLMQKRVGVSAAIVLIALMAGASLMGVVGALLAVPTAGVIQILVREYLEGREPA